jgi:hypothetical protein
MKSESGSTGKGRIDEDLIEAMVVVTMLRYISWSFWHVHLQDNRGIHLESYQITSRR